MTDVRDQIARIIEDRAYKQATIAHRAGLTPCKLSAILNRTRKLDANEFLMVCKAMGMSPEAVEKYESRKDA